MPARVASAGVPLDLAKAAIVLVHGRGASAESMLALADELAAGSAEDAQVAFLAPQAPDNTWYPYSFLAPIAQNEPYLSNALQLLDDLRISLDQSGLPAERVMMVGFSQGACLALEYTARYARRFGGVAGLSGGLIGPPGFERSYPGSLIGTPVFIGCSDIDPHIPEARVWETAQILEKMGAQVTTRIYPGMGHTINDDELLSLRQMIAVLSA